MASNRVKNHAVFSVYVYMADGAKIVDLYTLRLKSPQRVQRDASYDFVTFWREVYAIDIKILVWILRKRFLEFAIKIHVKQAITRGQL